MATGRAVAFDELLAQARAASVDRCWALTQLEEFARRRDGPRSLVVLGDPGAGKTMLLAKLADRLNCPHFFLGRSETVSAEQGGGWNEPIRCVETLGTQLVHTYGDEIVDWDRFGLDVRVLVGPVAGRVTGAQLARHDLVPLPPGKASRRVLVEASSVQAGGAVTGINIEQLSVDAIFATQELFLNPLRRAAIGTDDTIVVVLDALDQWDRSACADDLLAIVLRSALPPNVRFISSARRAYAARLDDASRILDVSSTATRADVDADIANLVDRHPRNLARPFSAGERARLIQQIAGNLLFGTFLLQGLESDDARDIGDPDLRDILSFYRREVRNLASRLEYEGLRSDLGSLLAIVCCAHEPIDLPTIATAAGLPKSKAADILDRLASFLPSRREGGTIRYFPYHRSFADFIDSDGAGLGLTRGSGSERLATTLLPANTHASGWQDASDYAIRHLLQHAVDAGEASRHLSHAILANHAYLVARARRLGVSALEADLRLARSAELDMARLAPAVTELSARAAQDVEAGTSTAQALAIASMAAGAPEDAKAFAALAANDVVAVPRWCWGFEAVVAAAGAMRSEGACDSASLTASGLLALTRADGGLEIWSLHARLPVAVLPHVAAELAEVEPDGAHAWLATSFEDGRAHIKRIRASDAAVLVDIELKHRVTALRFIGECGSLAVGTATGRLLLVSTEDGSVLAKRELGSRVACLCVDGGTLASLASNRKVVCWSLPGLALLAIHEIPKNNHFVAFNDRTDGLALDWLRRRAYVGAVDGSVFEVEFASEDEGRERRLCAIGAWADHLATTGDRLLVGDSSGYLHIVEPASANAPHKFRTHVSELVLCGQLAGTPLSVTVAKSGEVCLWNLEARAPRATQGHGRAVTDVVFSNGGDRLMSLGDDGSLIEWTQDGIARLRAFLHPDKLRSPRLVSDLNTVVFQDKQGKLQRQALDAAPEDLVSMSEWRRSVPDKCMSIFTTAPKPIAVSGDAALAVLASEFDALEICEFEPRLRRESLAGEQPAGRHALSADGAWMLTKNRDDELFVRALANGSQRRTVAEGGRPLCAPFSTPDGSRLLIHRDDRIVCLALETFEVCASWTSVDTPAFAIVSPDSRICVLFGKSGRVEFDALGDGRRLGGFVARPPASAAAFSPDGRSLAVGDEGGNLQFHDLTCTGGASP